MRTLRPKFSDLPRIIAVYKKISSLNKVLKLLYSTPFSFSLSALQTEREVKEVRIEGKRVLPLQVVS